MKAQKYSAQNEIKKATQSPEKWRFYMSTSAVNAYYTSNFNQMVFPAGILQPPFFHKDFPPAMNYGGIASVMGHELTHGFDDKGAQFNADGKLSNWWQPESLAKFKNLTQCVANEYSSYKTDTGDFLNGNLTCGENIADFGGVKLAYSALKKNLGSQGLTQPSVVQGVSNQQLFFLSYAHCGVRR
eukprot:TRINITY_DN12761_c0_g1_i1.p1 TRINITY_DN12761_c0_g1~~TRINITY_DN12761_c0_g1_i1.p1  ORF type:complete len:185 (-),score=43.17 TRINITY_DN12761_c0_g1_i1:225-779(-)